MTHPVTTPAKLAHALWANTSLFLNGSSVCRVDASDTVPGIIFTTTSGTTTTFTMEEVGNVGLDTDGNYYMLILVDKCGTANLLNVFVDGVDVGNTMYRVISDMKLT